MRIGWTREPDAPGKAVEASGAAAEAAERRAERAAGSPAKSRDQMWGDFCRSMGMNRGLRLRFSRVLLN